MLHGALEQTLLYRVVIGFFRFCDTPKRHPMNFCWTKFFQGFQVGGCAISDIGVETIFGVDFTVFAHYLIAGDFGYN